MDDLCRDEWAVRPQPEGHERLIRNGKGTREAEPPGGVKPEAWVVGGVAHHDDEVLAQLRRHVEPLLDESRPDPSALELGKDGHRCQRDRWHVARRIEMEAAEQDVPDDRLVLLRDDRELGDERGRRASLAISTASSGPPNASRFTRSMA